MGYVCPSEEQALSGRGMGLTALCLAVMALVAAGCASKGADPQTKGRKGDMAVPVTVAAVSQKDVPIVLQVIGNVEAYSTVTIRAQITGMMQRVHFREGDYVRKGDLLFTIDPAPFRAALDEEQANLAKSEALLSQAEANLSRDTAQEKYMRAQAARYTALFQQGVMSKDQTEQMQSNADALTQGLRADEAAINSARAAVVASRATVENARIQLSYTIIRSPIDGRTGNLSVKQGNLVTANSMDLITVNQIHPIYATFAVPESQLPTVKRYMAEGRLPVIAAPQDGDDSQETGVLTFVDNNVDMTTGTIKLKGTFANTDRKLWPGQYVRVTLRLTTQKQAVVVPNQAIQTGQDGSFVFVVKSDQTVESRPVVSGARIGQEMVVDNGLHPGEVVVTEGQLRLAPGMRVRIRPGTEGGPGRKKRG